MEVYLVYLVQILLVVHVFKTGRNRMWIFLLLFVPFVGGIAYLLVEVLPGLSTSMTGQRAMKGIRSSLDPGGETRRHAASFEHSPNADNARRYAAALLDAGKTDEAMQVLQQAMTGMFKTDPNLMLLQVRAQFDMDDPAAAVKSFRALRDSNPGFKSAAGHLLFARALQATGDLENSLDEYRAVAGYYPGAEAHYRLGVALQESGDTALARNQFEQMLRDARHAPGHFRKAQKHWLRKAERALKNLS